MISMSRRTGRSWFSRAFRKWLQAEIYTSDTTGAGCPARTGDVDAGKESCSLNEAHALTHVNDSLLAGISMAKADAFDFKGAHGDSVEGFLVKPPNFDASKKYPVKFLIHGGPQGAWGYEWSFRWNPQLFAANGYVVIMINFHGSTGYGQKFIDAINGDWGGAPFEDLMKGLDYAEQTYPFIDKNRECALGASYGGYAINWILGHTDRFKCLVSHDGMFNAESAWGTTEELWFNDWEFKGTPYDNRASLREVVAAPVREKFQDAHAGHPRPARLPARRERRIPAFHHAANGRRSVEDALLPRRRPLGAEAAELTALVQDGQRLGGPVDEVADLRSLVLGRGC